MNSFTYNTDSLESCLKRPDIPVSFISLLESRTALHL